MKSSELRQAGDAVVQGLISAGVKDVFGIPASHVIEVFNGLRTNHQLVRTVVARNEQSAAFMADGYARLGRKPGVAVVTGGPGLTNVATGLHTAYADSVPLVVVTSDLPPSERAQHPLGKPHELRDAEAVVRGTGADVVRIDDVERLPDRVADAVASSMAGRPHPVAIVLSRDVLGGKLGVDTDTGASIHTIGALPKTNWPDIAELSDALRAAEAPLVLAGAGVVRSDGRAALEDVLNAFRLPCLTTVAGRGSLGRDHPGFQGVLGQSERSRELVENADLLLAVGTSFGSASTGDWELILPRQLWHVDVDLNENGRHYTPTRFVHADARDFLSSLTAHGPSYRRSRSRRQPHHDNPWADALNASFAGKRTAIAVDVGTFTAWAPEMLDLSNDSEMMLPWNAMTLGWSLPAAIGAQIASSSIASIALIGDGGAMFCLGELAAAARADVPVIVVIFNNGAYQVISDLQANEYGAGGQFGVALGDVDFVLAARALGVRACRVTSPEQLNAQLREALGHRSPTVIEVAVTRDEFQATLR